MSQDPISEAIHFATRPFGEHYACGLVGYPNAPQVPHSNDPELVQGCVVCEAEAVAFMATNHKNLMAIFMGCGCEITTYIPKEEPGVVMAPHSCIDHNGHFIGGGTDDEEYNVIIATDEQVRQIWHETIQDLTND